MRLADVAGMFMLSCQCNQMKRCTFTLAALRMAAAADLTVVETANSGVTAVVLSEVEVRPMCERVGKV